MSNLNITCNPINLQGVAPGNINLAYIESAWDPVNVTAMTKCCAPSQAKESGCFTWCELNDHWSDVVGKNENWEFEFRDCLTKEGRLAQGGKDSTYMSPTVHTVLNGEENAAVTARLVGSFGTKGAVLVALGVLSWALM